MDQNAIGVLILQHVVIAVVEIVQPIIVPLDALALFTEYVLLALMLTIVNGAKICKLANQKGQMEPHAQLLLVLVMDTATFKEMEAVLLVIVTSVADGARILRNVWILEPVVVRSLKLAKHVIYTIIVIHVWTIQLVNGAMIPEHVLARNTDPNVTCLHTSAPIIAC